MATDTGNGFYNLTPVYPTAYNSALSFITPFTHRTNISYSDLLMELYEWLRNTHLPELDKILEEFKQQYLDDMQELRDDIQKTKDEWQALFDKFMADIIAQLEVMNDQAVANLISNELSKTREALEENFYARDIPVNNNELGYRKSIAHNLPLQFPLFDSYVDIWGREIVPQSFTVDETANELFVVYNGTATVVAVYDWVTSAFKTVFQLGDKNTTVTEGVSVIREGLARYIYIRTGVGTMSRFNITELPANGTSVTASADYPIVGLGRTYSYDGRYWYITDSSLRNVIRRLDSGFVDNGVIEIQKTLAGFTGELDNSISTNTPKIQGFTITRAGMFTGHGGYHQVDTTVTPYSMQGIRQFNLHGDLLAEYLVDTNAMAHAFYDAGMIKHLPRVFENEGVAYVKGELYSMSFTHGYNASEADIASDEGVLIIKEFSTDNDAIDFSVNARNPIIADNKNVAFVMGVRNYPRNQVTGAEINNIVDLVEYMALIDQQYGEFYSSTTNVVDTTGNQFPQGHIVKISMGTETNFIIDVVGQDAHSRRLYRSGGVWIENRIVDESPKPLTITASGGSGAYSPTYRRIRDEVVVDGAVQFTGGAPAGYVVVATLPEGYRPVKYQYYPSQIAGSTQQAFVRVQLNGDIEVSIGGSSPASALLTGIRFRSPIVIGE